MTFEELEKANKTISTTNIKGKEYAEVNQRIKAFRMLHPSGEIRTDLISNENGTAIIKATICDENGKVLGTGLAYEKEGSTFINKTSYIENCETSAVGRALGMCGIGIDTSVRSAEEVENAQIQQVAEDKITKTKADALMQAVENAQLNTSQVNSILNSYNYNNVEEIKNKDYMEIVNKLKELKEA